MPFLEKGTVLLLKELYRDLAKKALSGGTPVESAPRLQSALFSQMERDSSAATANAKSAFWSSQAWSLGHFLDTSTLDQSATPVQLAAGESVSRILGRPLADIKRDFEAEAASVVGAGWVWLVRPWTGTPPAHRSSPHHRTVDSGGLRIVSCPGAASPLHAGGHPCTPILGLDLWEHAYWRDYGLEQSRYLEAWWESIRWDTLVPLLAVSASKLASVQVNRDYNYR